jgi:hypothetical protein
MHPYTNSVEQACPCATSAEPHAVCRVCVPRGVKTAVEKARAAPRRGIARADTRNMVPPAGSLRCILIGLFYGIFHVDICLEQGEETLLLKRAWHRTAACRFDDVPFGHACADRIAE